MNNDWSAEFETKYEEVRGLLASGLLLNALNAVYELLGLAVTDFEFDVATAFKDLLKEAVENGIASEEYGSEN